MVNMASFDDRSPQPGEAAEWLQALERCGTQEEWNRTIAKLVLHLWGRAASPDGFLKGEVHNAAIPILVRLEQGLRISPHRGRLSQSSHEDADIIRRMHLRTTPQATEFLASWHGISREAARKRVALARREAGLTLEAGRRYGKIPPPSFR